MRHKTATILRKLTNNRAEYRRAKRLYNKLPRNKRFNFIAEAREAMDVLGRGIVTRERLT